MVVDTGKQHWPLVARWTQSTADGAIHWYLGGLQADGRFWGYAHFRSESRQENQSFAGTLIGDVLTQVATIVRELASASPSEPSGSSLGLVGVGSRSSYHLIFELPSDVGKYPNSKLLAAYRSFIELLQPAVTQALADGINDRKN